MKTKTSKSLIKFLLNLKKENETEFKKILKIEIYLDKKRKLVKYSIFSLKDILYDIFIKSLIRTSIFMILLFILIKLNILCII
jgi:hypothetical protein